MSLASPSVQHRGNGGEGIRSLGLVVMESLHFDQNLTGVNISRLCLGGRNHLISESAVSSLMKLV